MECQDCDPELKKICRGGCKAAAEQCLGTLEHVDPFVTISKGIEWGVQHSQGVEEPSDGVSKSTKLQGR